jgi:hypothetical protein
VLAAFDGVGDDGGAAAAARAAAIDGDGDALAVGRDRGTERLPGDEGDEARAVRACGEDAVHEPPRAHVGPDEREVLAVRRDDGIAEHALRQLRGDHRIGAAHEVLRLAAGPGDFGDGAVALAWTARGASDEEPPSVRRPRRPASCAQARRDACNLHALDVGGVDVAVAVAGRDEREGLAVG